MPDAPRKPDYKPMPQTSSWSSPPQPVEYRGPSDDEFFEFNRSMTEEDFLRMMEEDPALWELVLEMQRGSQPVGPTPYPRATGGSSRGGYRAPR